jgi:hypothetical protein
MREPVRLSDDQLAGALTALGRDVAYPATPTLVSAVTARLDTDRAGRSRPAFPRAALWGRRRTLVLVAVGLLALLGLAAAARLAIGAFEIRVQPGVTPSVSLPPVDPDVLGEPLPPAEAVAIAGFDPPLPAGPAPDEVYVVDSPFGDPGLVFAWRPTERYPEVAGTDWGLLLMAFQGDDEQVVKTVERFEHVEGASVNGRRAYWIAVPHEIVVETERGAETFSVEGNVLIWHVGDIAYRMETSLGRGAAIEVAGSVG